MAIYRLADSASDLVSKEMTNYSPLLVKLLAARGITDLVTAQNFLSPSYDEGLHNPFLLHDIEKAARRILRAIADEEVIVIYSDYDCDGIPGGVVLHDLFKAIGYTKFYNHIPHRHYDGFGLHAHAVETIHQNGASLIITVDCGTTDVVAVVRAKELGIDVIITDHHQPGEVLPDAYAIVNPQLGDYPFRGLCGAAVAYKLAQVVLSLGDFSVKPGMEKWWLDMVGLATIADMVPLVDENRVFAYYGLMVLRKTRRPGLLQLLRQQRVDVRNVTEDDIGFTIAPRINAASRMDTPEDAFHMLASLDEVIAGAHATHLEKLNNERKGIVAAMTREAHGHLRALAEVPPVIVLGNPSWRPSLAGLVANKLAEEHARPAFVWGRDGNGMIKGSCRSGGSVSVHALMQAVADHFLEYGGHHASGGFGVRDEAIHTLPQALIDAYQGLGSEAVVEEVRIVDHACSIDELSNEVWRTLTQFAPFGVGNPRPLFKVEATPDTVVTFGKGGEHTRLTFKTRGIAREAIAFFKQPVDFSIVPKAGHKLTLLAHLEQSAFNGRVQTRLRLIDVES